MIRLTLILIVGRVLDITLTNFGIGLGLKEANPFTKLLAPNSTTLGLTILAAIFIAIFWFGGKYVVARAGRNGLYYMYTILVISYVPIIINLVWILLRLWQKN